MLAKLFRAFRRFKYNRNIDRHSDIAPRLRFDASVTVLAVLDKMTAQLQHAC